MVDEFSSFARMPKPQMEARNIAETLNEATFLQKVALPEIDFVTDFGGERLYGFYDTRLLSQAFINIIKNAAEAIGNKEHNLKEKGRIEVRARRQGDNCIIDVID
ncbi:MAG: PAS domain-containing sensor histidine kinase, partial [Nitratireductor sp.]|nr:PAS domain-containing sensor histidine kinase [Nitratireductor sp.]